MSTEIDMINADINALEQEINENETLSSAYRKLRKMQERAAKAEVRLASFEQHKPSHGFSLQPQRAITNALSTPTIMLLSAAACAVAYVVFRVTA